MLALSSACEIFDIGEMKRNRLKSLLVLSPNRLPHASSARQQNKSPDTVPRRGIRGSGSRVNLSSASTSRRASGLLTSRLIWMFSINGAMCPALLWPFQRVRRVAVNRSVRGPKLTPQLYSYPARNQME